MSDMNANKQQLDLTLRNLFKDERVNYFRFLTHIDKGIIHLNAWVDNEENKDKMLDVIAEFHPQVNVNVKVLGSEIPDGLKYAQVMFPTLDIREGPRFRSERNDQLIFGEWVKVLEIGTDYSLVKDFNHGYLGYANNNGLGFCTMEEMSRITSKNMYKIHSRFGHCEKSDDLSNAMWLSMGSYIFTDEPENPVFETAMGEYELVQGLIGKDDCSQESFEKKIKAFMGTPYLLGGSSVFGIDCSGLVGRLYNLAGTIIPRDSDQQESALKKIEPQERRFGDLIFFPGHVGMYIGADLMLHSNIYRGRVSVDNVFSPNQSYGYRLNEQISSLRRPDIVIE